MKANLRKSLDMALQTQRMLKLGLQIVTKSLEKETAFEDALIVYLAEWCNVTIYQLSEIDKTIEVITEQMQLFGDEGLEKELSISFEGGSDE